MALQNCTMNMDCGDDCTVYDLCKVTIKPSSNKAKCLPNQETQIICEGFKFTSKLDVDVKTNSACYEGYGYQISNLQYEWEITNPCDKDWFDKRFVAQLCDKYSMEITGYVQADCDGNWIAKETLTCCIIEETGREFGKGLSRSIKGKALHRILNDKEDDDGNISNESKDSKNKRKKTVGVDIADGETTIGLLSTFYENLPGAYPAIFRYMFGDSDITDLNDPYEVIRTLAQVEGVNPITYDNLVKSLKPYGVKLLNNFK